MEHTTSVGPEAARPDDKHELPGSTGRVDAHDANELDLRHGRAGAEAKPFSPVRRGAAKADPSPQNKGLVSERRTAGRDDGISNSTADATSSGH